MSENREEQLRQIRERQSRRHLQVQPDVVRPRFSSMYSDIEFLLSLLDGEAADEKPEVAEESCCISALLHSRERAAQKRKLEPEQK